MKLKSNRREDSLVFQKCIQIDKYMHESRILTPLECKKVDSSVFQKVLGPWQAVGICLAPRNCYAFIHFMDSQIHSMLNKGNLAYQNKKMVLSGSTINITIVHLLFQVEVFPTSLLRSVWVCVVRVSLYPFFFLI